MGYCLVDFYEPWESALSWIDDGLDNVRYYDSGYVHVRGWKLDKDNENINDLALYCIKKIVASLS